MICLVYSELYTRYIMWLVPLYSSQLQRQQLQQQEKEEEEERLRREAEEQQAQELARNRKKAEAERRKELVSQIPHDFFQPPPQTTPHQ